jgi:16S rRNA (uracil1498-N3)-methyltransferase
MHLLYTTAIRDGQATLSETESNHCVRVLRLTVGDTALLTDGRGALYQARIAADNPKRCELTITAILPAAGKRPYYLQMAVAPTKNIERYEQLIEKATEIGVDAITPLLCEHSERRTVNLPRLEKCMIAAMKQSLKTRLPLLAPPVAFSDFIRQPFDGEKYIGCCRDDVPRTPFWPSLPPGGRMLALIGPEGDFSPTEMQLALQASFRPVTFGDSRFRVETAGMLVCMAAYMAMGLGLATGREGVR